MPSRCRSLPSNARGFVAPTTMFGAGYRYFESHFPFLIYFRVESDDDTERELILIQLVVPAFTGRP